MKASDVMSRNILSVGRDATIAEAIRLMLDNQISGLPVIDAGRLVGILTEGDLLRRSETGTERHRPRWLEIRWDRDGWPANMSAPTGARSRRS